MTLEEIKENLCIYDPLNPDDLYNDEDREFRKRDLERQSRKVSYEVTCSCDNCFYGRHDLVKELLNSLKF